MPPVHTLTVPIDASTVKDAKPGEKVKVAVQLKDGSIQSDVVKLPASKTAKANFKFKANPGSLRIAVGPADASDEELMGLETVNVAVTPRAWKEATKLTLSPVQISPFYWRRWLTWCRKVTIQGRIICPDGSPVPGAEVTALDVDWWWWWCSSQQVGTATTDHTGTFEITFRHCCHWLPWWWWRQRYWHLAPEVAEQLVPVLRRDLKLERIPKPSPRPDLSIFSELLGEEPIAPPMDLRRAALTRPVNSRLRLASLKKRGLTPGSASQFDTGRLESVRKKLLQRMPVVPELQRLRLWPWYPWRPWADCSPDIIFRVKQQCGGEEKVIIDENCWDTRWNVGSSLDVTLVAPDACCIHDPCTDPNDCPDGECIVITEVCNLVVNTVGGNPGADPTPEGYYIGGTAGSGAIADKPFGGVVPISGVFGNAADVDYYEFEISDDGGATYADLPPAAAGGFSRMYWGPLLGTGDPAAFHTVPFNPQVISGRRVFESREHFEASNDPASWSGPGQTRFWASNRDLLMRLVTANVLADGTYDLRVRAYEGGPGALQLPGSVLPLCDTEDENGLVLELDNRLVGPASGHPASTPDHPTGAGTVHLQTYEPDTDIVGVYVDGVEVNPCAIVDASSATTLRIRFLASDSDGHLSRYLLRATYGENFTVPLLSLPSSTLAIVSGAQVGPTYADAVSQGATRPHWDGGVYDLTVLVAEAFPTSCAYQLELEARKRTIVSCNASDPHRNWSHVSFTVEV